MTPRQAAMWLTFELEIEKRDLSLGIVAVNLGMAGDRRAIDSALRKFDQ